MRSSLIPLLLCLLPACAGPGGSPPVVAEPSGAAPRAPSDEDPAGDEDGVQDPDGGWSRCSASTECVLVLTRAGACCSDAEYRAVNAGHRAAASRAWGPSPEELRQARHASAICTKSCEAPPRQVAACRDSACVVATESEAPDGVGEAPPGGHLDRAPDGGCIWWPSHCDDAPCTVSTRRVRCPVPFVKR
jgi:hypothetical protein